MSDPLADRPSTVFLTLKSATCRKLGRSPVGSLHYAVLTDLGRTELFLRLTGNDGGGLFSSVPVALSPLRSLVELLPESFPSRALASLFSNRSTNNVAFLAAALRAESLLCADPERPLLHRVTGDWSRWRDACLALVAPDQLAPTEAEPSRPRRQLRLRAQEPDHAPAA